MAADRLTQAVRQQLGLGRLLPLGGAADGAWITEHAAVGALRRAASAALPGVRLGTVRLALADPATAVPAAVPAPPSALPAGPLRLTADFAATVDEPLPAVAGRLRAALWSAGAETLGLDLDAVDLRATALLDGPEAVGTAEAVTAPERQADAESGAEAGTEAGTGSGTEAGTEAGTGSATESGTEDDGSAARVVRAVPGVARLAPVLGGPAHAVRTRDRTDEEPGRHRQVQIAVTEGRCALDVTAAVREAVAVATADDAPGPVTVAVVVTAVDPVGRTAH
ncbi:hypothetical protein [Streptomyces syringium]|uniref:hypothetical protein n=1 Tax=Streptomyces syringium TaxID=76729 RepID=UPI0037D486BC